MPTAPRTNRNRIILILIIILCVTVITFYVRESDSGPLHKVQNFFLDMVSPISSGFSKLFRPIKDGFVNLWHLPSLSKQKKELEKEVADLRRKSLELRELESEYEDLKRKINWVEENPELGTVGAEIVGQSPDNWQRLMIVNKGSASGIKKYMAVVTEEGLVGRIISVGSHSSVVQLLTDSRAKIGARDQRNMETGIVEGRNEEIIRFVPMNDETVIETGDTIVTSGLGGTCPSGIAVGKVTKVKKRSKGLPKLVEVKPFVRISRLDKVVIIITPEPESVILKEGQ